MKKQFRLLSVVLASSIIAFMFSGCSIITEIKAKKAIEKADKHYSESKSIVQKTKLDFSYTNGNVTTRSSIDSDIIAIKDDEGKTSLYSLKSIVANGEDKTEYNYVYDGSKFYYSYNDAKFCADTSLVDFRAYYEKNTDEDSSLNGIFDKYEYTADDGGYKVKYSKPNSIQLEEAYNSYDTYIEMFFYGGTVTDMSGEMYVSKDGYLIEDTVNIKVEKTKGGQELEIKAVLKPDKDADCAVKAPLDVDTYKSVTDVIAFMDAYTSVGNYTSLKSGNFCVTSEVRIPKMDYMSNQEAAISYSLSDDGVTALSIICNNLSSSEGETVSSSEKYTYADKKLTTEIDGESQTEDCTQDDINEWFYSFYQDIYAYSDLCSDVTKEQSAEQIVYTFIYDNTATEEFLGGVLSLMGIEQYDTLEVVKTGCKITTGADGKFNSTVQTINAKVHASRETVDINISSTVKDVIPEGQTV